MSSQLPGGESVFRRWLDSLKESDPELYKELVTRLEQRVAAPESVTSPVSDVTLESASRGVDVQAIALETIVREGRPALLIRENRIDHGVIVDAAAEVIVKRLREAASVLEPIIPLVGRIDVDNYPGPLNYLGTGWVIDRNVVITNRHVAELMARADDGKFRFRPGRFGEDLRVAVDYRREKDINASSVSRVRRIIWIETDPRKADIAFLEVDRRSDGVSQDYIVLADSDAVPANDVAVVGYPARAPAHIIPNQAWMDQIYGSTYDVKRIAPGLMGANSRGWATHDCTTLGGNSGSVVLDMKNGRAVALHFAGLYMIENYAVPASTIKKYLADRPWHSSGPNRPEPPPPAPPANIISQDEQGSPSPQGAGAGTAVRADRAQMSVTIPLVVTITVGELQTTGASSHPSPPSPPPDTHDAPPRDIDQAARILLRDRRVEGVYSVWAGYRIEQGRLTDDECLVISAHPSRLDAVREAMPKTYGQFPVELRPASIDEQMQEAGLAEAPVTSVMYNDDDRTDSGFSFDWVEEEMNVLLHVGPERSWSVLSDFLDGAQSELVSSIYEFHAAHIADAVEKELKEGAEMTLVMARQTRDPKNDKIPQGDFDRSDTFAKWAKRYGNRFERVYVPIGAQGLVANSYHIKVTVRDRSSVWLSSGNWKRSSQPLIPTASLNDPKVTSGAGNREWHVVIDNETLAERFRNHILADYEKSLELGGTLEAVEDEVLIDVPQAMLEAVQFEAPAARTIKPHKISRRVRVKPLLTPDRQGAVFSNAVLQLIRSSKKQLLFQNQYIKMRGAESGFLKKLVDALAQKAKELDDFRIILRSGNEEEDYDLTQLKRRGVDVMEQVRILPNTHTKGIIVDGRRVLVGSHNWSSSGVTLNRDASLIFDDEEVAQYYTEAFELDWERAREPHFEEVVTEGVKPAVGDAPPPGYVRMRLADYMEG
jgi:phosphatidylserine/phosphatidylglycerophosphate/cardiolipin synthase-like enzyme/V8-like Glu-specific endopeptidase